MPVVAIEGLVKSFGGVRALDGIDLRIESGEVLGYLGPNGAGKSTTIRILLGLLRRDGGTATVWGLDPWDSAVDLHRRMAYVPGDVNLWPNLSGGEAIDVLAGLRGGFDRGRRDEYVQRFELDPGKKCGTYSKGNRQKVALVAAFSGDADLLVLDEPTSGLDPLMGAVFDACIAEAKDEGRSVLLSSHTLSQVEKLCDTISIIRSGRIVESGTLTDLRHLTRTRVRATTRHRPTLDRLTGVHHLEVDGIRVDFDVDAEALAEAVEALQLAGLESLTCQPPSLEELFLRHYSAREQQEVAR